VSSAPFGSFGVPLALLVGRNEAVASAIRHGFDDQATACIARAVLTDQQFRKELSDAVKAQEHITIEPSRDAYRRGVAACDASR
jgi:predicted DNA-binding WGR domain protein